MVQCDTMQAPRALVPVLPPPPGVVAVAADMVVVVVAVGGLVVGVAEELSLGGAAQS